MEYGFNQVVFLPRRVLPSCNIYNLTAYKNKGASWSHLGDLRKFCINLQRSTPQCLPPSFCVWPLWWVRSPIPTHVSVEIPQKHMHHGLLITDVVQAQHWLSTGGNCHGLSTSYYFHMIPKSLNGLQVSEYTEASLWFRFANKNTFSATIVKI